MSINRFKGFDNIVDASTKTHTNFFLTPQISPTSFIISGDDQKKANSISTHIKYGTEYLNITAIDPTPYKTESRYEEIYDYRAMVFTESPQTFFIEIYDQNICNVYALDNYLKFYLCSDQNNEMFFINESLLTFNEDSIDPQDFHFLFSEKNREMALFQYKENEKYYVAKTDTLVLSTLSAGDPFDFWNERFVVNKSIYTRIPKHPKISHIKYNNDNTINTDDIFSELEHNFIIHRNNSDNVMDFIFLKNHYTQDDLITSGNNLLSGHPYPVNGLRSYTSIFSDIGEEESENLEMNYTFNDKGYVFKSGETKFTAPSSMFPYETMNINDTNFVINGAFGYITPEFADKIYENRNTITNQSQHLLCTWLSGSGDNKVWVDRYYYPDVVSKEEALSGKPIFQMTYNDTIEELIQNNATLKKSTTIQKFFDKRSDMTIHPNGKYTYKRLESDVLDFPTFTYCDLYSSFYPKNYFSELNDAGKFSINFYFKGDSKIWTLSSNRNDINSGLSIRKSVDQIFLEYILYNPSNSSYTTFTYEEPFRKGKQNFISFSIDSIASVGYYVLNNISHKISIPTLQFHNKNLIYGDFFLNYEGDNVNVLIDDSIIENFRVSDIITNKDLAFIIPLIDGVESVNDIHVTIPSGARNSTDEISILHKICNASSKSKKVNLKIKNSNIDEDSIIDAIEQEISGILDKTLPVNIEVNEILFENFKK